MKRVSISRWRVISTLRKPITGNGFWPRGASKSSIGFCRCFTDLEQSWESASRRNVVKSWAGILIPEDFYLKFSNILLALKQRIIYPALWTDKATPTNSVKPGKKPFVPCLLSDLIRRIKGSLTFKPIVLRCQIILLRFNGWLWITSRLSDILW